MSAQINRLPDHALLQLLRPLQVYLDDEAITEIRINRPGEVLTQTRHGKTHHSCVLLTYAYLKGLMTAIQTYNGLSHQAQHYAMLPSGERVTMLQPPAVLEGVLTIIIRKHASVSKPLAQLAEEGAFKPCQLVGQQRDQHKHNTLTPTNQHLLNLAQENNWVDFLSDCVKHKRNIVIAGKTGSGKTTLARSLIACIPSDERLVTLEDVHELSLPDHDDKLHLLYGDQVGRLSATESLSSCMRLSPDRILLAELRGHEAWDYITSLNTGHPGSITTTHANSAAHTFDRIATLIKQSPLGVTLDVPTVERVLFQTIDVVIYMQHFQITEIFFAPHLTQKTGVS